jgi:hypothetical protein
MQQGSPVYSRIVVAIFAIAVCSLFYSTQFGCGSGVSAGRDDDTSSPDVDAPPGETPLDDVETLIKSQVYAGSLVLHLSEDLHARTADGRLTVGAGHCEERSDEAIPCEDVVSAIQSAIDSYDGAKLKPLSDVDPDKMDARRAYLEELNRTKLPDMNSVVEIEVKDTDEAIKLYRALKDLRGVEAIYPQTIPHPTSLSTTPDLTSTQGYLFSYEAKGGLNAKYAWDQGVHGENVVIVDNEGNWDLNHLDLPLDASKLITGLSCTTPDESQVCKEQANHGAAIVGILASIDNGHGTTGVAYESDVYVAVATDVGEMLGQLTDGQGDSIHDELPPGSVFLIEVGIEGALSDPESGCQVSQYGCIPIEAATAVYNVVQLATAAGITVVEVADNGSVNLNNTNVYYDFQTKLGMVPDSGSILVGASVGGGDHHKADFSNCGTPIDLFGWGGYVATAGYGYPGNPFTWVTIPGGPNPPNTDPHAYFINTASGTSSAAAMVAGAAALLQSYAKQEFQEISTRYLMPGKVRDILYNSGISQAGGGCSIGKQPRMNVAFGLVDTFVNQVFAQYPALNGGHLTHDELVALRAMGLGLACGTIDIEHHVIAGLHDPSCPEIDETELWPKGNYISKDLDFDGDYRADLVQWTNGTWKIDLSSVGDGGDNYGAWDVIVNYPPIEGKWVWPYIADMDSDGRTDFVVYDKEHGEWYIAYMNYDILEAGTWPGWDRIIDYSSEWVDDRKMNEWESNYSRPAVGDYDGDGFNDIAISCSDGYWRIDYGGPNDADLGVFEKVVQYLTDEQLAQAPGWAYLTVMGFGKGGDTPIAYKIPDGVTNEGQFKVFIAPDYTIEVMAMSYIFINYGGNEAIPLAGDYYSQGATLPAVKTPSGEWLLTDLNFNPDNFTFDPEIKYLDPSTGYGDKTCHPVVANFDGDYYDDRAVMCKDGWRIAYSNPDFAAYEDADGMRRIDLGYTSGTMLTLPGRSYSGGISYAYAQQLINYYKISHPSTPPPIIVDMPGFGAQ